MLRWLRWLEEKISAFERVLLVVLLLTMVSLAFVLVLLRNFFNSGIIGADEFLRHLVLLVAFFGASLAASLKKHINIDVLTIFLKGSVRHLAGIVVNGVSLLVTILLARAAWEFVMIERSFGSPDIFGVAVWMYQLVIPGGFFPIGYRFFIHLLEEFVLIFREGSK